jgi:hypothetical protein
MPLWIVSLAGPAFPDHTARGSFCVGPAPDRLRPPQRAHFAIPENFPCHSTNVKWFRGQAKEV